MEAMQALYKFLPPFVSAQTIIFPIEIKPNGTKLWSTSQHLRMDALTIFFMVSTNLSSGEHTRGAGALEPVIAGKNSITGKKMHLNFALVIPLRSDAERLATNRPLWSTTAHALHLHSMILRNPSIALSLMEMVAKGSKSDIHWLTLILVRDSSWSSLRMQEVKFGVLKDSSPDMLTKVAKHICLTANFGFHESTSPSY